MKALTIRQPWVHAILQEGKNIENRNWSTKHRGWIALHSSAKPLPDQNFPNRLRIPDLKNLDYSAICGVARVSDVITKSRSKWFHHPADGSINYGWLLTDIILLKEAIPCSGALKLWTVPTAVVRKIQRQLPHIDLKNEDP